MSVTVKFWSFSKRKNSTLIPTASPSYSYDCQLKAETTLINPIIELNTDQAKGCNYAQIADFGRYYFIRDWTFDRGLWTASLEEDVLGSWKSQIGAQTMYVTRSASSYDGDIKDMLYPTTDAVTHNYVTLDYTGGTFSTGVYVIGVLGDNTASGSSVFWQLTPSNFGALIQELFNAADGNFDWTDVVDGIKNSIMNPTQYIVSCRWYPRAFDTTGSATKIKSGFWESATALGTKLSGNIVPLTKNYALPKHPLAATRGSYMNLSPYARYAIQWGSRYDLDTSLLAKESEVYVRIIPDFTQCEALLQVYPGSSGSTRIPLIACYVPFGVDIPLAQSAIEPGGLMAIAAGTLTAMATANPIGAAAGLFAASDAAIGGVSSTKSGGGIVSSMATGYISAAFYDVVDDDLADFGRPLMKKKQISTLSGFVRCQNDDISIACLDPERDSIRAFMTGGFFYE